ncbi:YibE/F family protein [Limosilactobacillus fermentum]|uniref:YibE/F family protein n=1 Tax=Limosilactobacillus fermentum TaxID=1613 RepID=UPI0010237EC7|nr:YibE/F family protein [Limosilactobacillus fermentum]QBE60201.1 YibE/F family protein [Limosilactobacillus fermentum]WNY95344.1 YibE/F family protein [Limosilactobacillus fermentum]
MWKTGWWKAKYKLVIALIVLGVGAMIFTTHNQRLYKAPLAQVVAVENGKAQKETDEFQNVDYQVNQTLTVKMLNGKYTGKEFKVNNTYTKSGALDQRYYPGNQIFLSQLTKRNGHLTANVAGYKRDVVLVFLGWLVIFLLVLMMGRAGSLAMLSVCLNAILFYFAIQIDLKMQASHAFLTFSILALLFAALSLLLVLGPTKKMVATFLATVLGTSVAMLVSVLVMNLTHHQGIYYESMQYVTQVPRPLFLAETLLGSLGAVMDEASDIVATLHELHEIDPTISRRQLFLSGRNIGKSIMGPLVNVLFMIFMADTFTSALLYIKNGNNWGYTFSMNMSLGTVQSLVSGIGIVLAIPLVSAFAALLYGRKGEAA